MELAHLLAPEGVIANLKAKSKKQALRELSERASKLCPIDSQKILEALLAREKLGTTGVGQGVALPHAKLAEADELFGLFARLEYPVDFDSVDERPVDLIFLLIAPEGAGAEHLRALARISRMLRDSEFCGKLRGSRGRAALYALLTESAPSSPSTSSSSASPVA